MRSYRAGENSQLMALANRLGYDCDIKELHYRATGFIPNLLRQSTLAGIDPARSSSLQPPWPDLILSAGLRNEPVCRWIKSRSGGKTRLVHIGRPWAGLEHFDLVITTPQYRLPEHPHVLHNELTLHNVTEQRLARAAEKWKPCFSHLPEPWYAVLIGGSSGPYALGTRAASCLGKAANRLAASGNGSLLVTTSSRTPKHLVTHFRNNVTVPSELFEWSEGNGENPYLGFLALARGIVVTADSVAMLSEACATGKAVYIFDPGRCKHHDLQAGSVLYRCMMKMGPRRLSRDTSLVHRQQIDAGRAAWLGDPFTGRHAARPRDMDRALERVGSLLPGNPEPHKK